MRITIMGLLCIILGAGNSLAAARSMTLAVSPAQVAAGSPVQLACTAAGGWSLPLVSAQVTIKDPGGTTLVSGQAMNLSGTTAGYDYAVPADGPAGTWNYSCALRDRKTKLTKSGTFTVTAQALSPIAAHNTITRYDGPVTCLSCHATQGTEMVDSLHAKWKAPTPELTNTRGEELGKALGGINTFCTYAMSSKNACFSCHVRADGNAPHPAEAKDIDCLMCHSDTYQRKFVADPNNTETVTNVNGETKTYVFGKVDSQGNYMIEPDYNKMPAGTTMVNLARTVHLPTNTSCLRCHATAGGGDWTKRGDLGLNSANPTVDQDVHLARDGAALSCVDCHSNLNHKIGGRGIDLRGTEGDPPTCQACHTATPHSNATLNRHAAGQVSCQVCHIRTFAKGGATEMSRDFNVPVWNAAQLSGQGGFIGEEIKEANVKPEYVWFVGTSYVYNTGETIQPDAEGVYHMARANGAPFDGNSSIVPIKRHFTTMPLHESGKMVPPAIVWMFMTGKFDVAIQKGMEEQGLTGNYSMVLADAEMLITHGVEPKAQAPSCVECHDNTGRTADGTGMLPLTALGYHTLPKAVVSCTLCHEQKNLGWTATHQQHRGEVSCASCHTKEPTGLVKESRVLCSSCHSLKSWNGTELHKKHVEKQVSCATCHTFS
ncbi:MAG: hypothetical protein RBS95_02505 [Desulfobulbus sp.]|jgi:hypothetical protein|nr:hypothetical protein [Desulfobulbus sp.]